MQVEIVFTMEDIKRALAEKVGKLYPHENITPAMILFEELAYWPGNDTWKAYNMKHTLRARFKRHSITLEH